MSELREDGTRGDIKRAVTAYGKKKYDEGFKAGYEEAEKDRKYKTILEAVKQAYEEGRSKASALYENVIEDQERERVKQAEEIIDLEAKIRALQARDGDFSHNQMPNTYSGKTNIKEFTADDWYRDNFKGDAE